MALQSGVYRTPGGEVIGIEKNQASVKVEGPGWSKNYTIARTDNEAVAAKGDLLQWMQTTELEEAPYELRVTTIDQKGTKTYRGPLKQPATEQIPDGNFPPFPEGYYACTFQPGLWYFRAEGGNNSMLTVTAPNGTEMAPMNAYGMLTGWFSSKLQWPLHDDWRTVINNDTYGQWFLEYEFDASESNRVRMEFTINSRTVGYFVGPIY